MELSEAALLSDAFVFRLSFRIYDLPKAVSDYLAALAPERTSSRGAAAYFQSRRLLRAYAALSFDAKDRRDGKPIAVSRYLTISALTLDSGSGRCWALDQGKCSLYDRRPLACRTVPLHYSRPEALAALDLDAFVATPGFACDTGPSASLLLDDGRIVDDQILTAREQGFAIAEADRGWKSAIVRRMKSGGLVGLPTLQDIRDNSPYGVTTTSMRLAWQIAVEAGPMSSEQMKALLTAQIVAIDRQIATLEVLADTRETLTEMRAEYGLALNAA